jgi:2-(1,2-epoxy-1,2-dihydrophenyl)acetyl-CoA isomerase
MPMAEQHVLTRVEDGIGWITLNRPEVRNALSPAMVDGLIEATYRFEHDKAVRCVVISGAGGHFMAGGDIKGFDRALKEDRDNHLRAFEMRVVRVHQIIYQLRRMEKPVLVSVQGAAAGFGLSVVLAADLAIAADDAFFTLAYRHIGLTADGGSTYFLPRVVGERRALEIALLGDRFTAERALSIGILNWVVPAASLAEETLKTARALADGPTVALGKAKQLIRTSLDNSWDEHSHREAESMVIAASTEDHLEGVAAFLEKRKPAFKGK